MLSRIQGEMLTYSASNWFENLPSSVIAVLIEVGDRDLTAIQSKVYLQVQSVMNIYMHCDNNISK